MRAHNHLSSGAVFRANHKSSDVIKHVEQLIENFSIDENFDNYADPEFKRFALSANLFLFGNHNSPTSNSLYYLFHGYERFSPNLATIDTLLKPLAQIYNLAGHQITALKLIYEQFFSNHHDNFLFQMKLNAEEVEKLCYAAVSLGAKHKFQVPGLDEGTSNIAAIKKAIETYPEELDSKLFARLSKLQVRMLALSDVPLDIVCVSNKARAIVNFDDNTDAFERVDQIVKASFADFLEGLSGDSSTVSSKIYNSSLFGYKDDSVSEAEKAKRLLGLLVSNSNLIGFVVIKEVYKLFKHISSYNELKSIFVFLLFQKQSFLHAEMFLKELHELLLRKKEYITPVFFNLFADFSDHYFAQMRKEKKAYSSVIEIILEQLGRDEDVKKYSFELRSICGLYALLDFSSDKSRSLARSFFNWFKVAEFEQKPQLLSKMMTDGEIRPANNFICSDIQAFFYSECYFFLINLFENGSDYLPYLQFYFNPRVIQSYAQTSSVVKFIHEYIMRDADKLIQFFHDIKNKDALIRFDINIGMFECVFDRKEFWGLLPFILSKYFENKVHHIVRAARVSTGKEKQCYALILLETKDAMKTNFEEVFDGEKPSDKFIRKYTQLLFDEIVQVASHAPDWARKGTTVRNARALINSFSLFFSCLHYNFELIEYFPTDKLYALLTSTLHAFSLVIDQRQILFLNELYIKCIKRALVVDKESLMRHLHFDLIHTSLPRCRPNLVKVFINILNSTDDPKYLSFLSGFLTPGEIRSSLSDINMRNINGGFAQPLLFATKPTDTRKLRPFVLDIFGMMFGERSKRYLKVGAGDLLLSNHFVYMLDLVTKHEAEQIFEKYATNITEMFSIPHSQTYTDKKAFLAKHRLTWLAHSKGQWSMSDLSPF